MNKKTDKLSDHNTENLVCDSGEKIACDLCGKESDSFGHWEGSFFAIRVPNREIKCYCGNCMKLLADLYHEQYESYGGLDNDASEKTDFCDKIGMVTPRQITDLLDEYIIGQPKAKKVLAVGMYNHIKRMISNGENTPKLEKSNIIMIGPTGSGKTLFARTLSELLDVPFVIADATAITQAGYVGENAEDMLKRLYEASGRDLYATEHGIIYIDEVDKLSGETSDHRNANISTVGTQRALLKLLEGHQIKVNMGNYMEPNMVTVDTSNILFICGGAFDGMDQILEKKEKIIGFGTGSCSTDTDRALRKDITANDLIEYGLIPEFAGRVPCIVTLDRLTEEDLRDIMVKPKNALLKQYEYLFQMDHVEVEFSDGFIQDVAHKAYLADTGARGLRNILEQKLTGPMYEIPSNPEIGRIVVTLDEVQYVHRGT